MAISDSSEPVLLSVIASEAARRGGACPDAGVEGRSALIIHTPLIHLTKAQIIQRGTALGLDLGLTWSCYDPTADGQPCRACDSCVLRERGFAEAGISDPALRERSRMRQ